MDLDLSPVRTRGRAEKEIAFGEPEPLTAADVAMLAVERGIKPPTVENLRDSHHALARTLARGVSHVEASVITGYSQSRISILLRSPAFAELVEFYRDNLAFEATNDRERLRLMAMDVLQALHEEVVEEPERFSPGFRLQVFETLADRSSGLTKESRSVNTTNVNVSYAERFERSMERARLIDVTPAATDREKDR